MMHTPHFLVGVAIATHVPDPIAATVAAVASHFVLDAIPHSDYVGKPELTWQNLLLVFGDGVVAIGLFFLFVTPDLWGYAFFVAIMANLPDLIWIPKYFWPKWQTLPGIRQFGDWHGKQLQYDRELPFLKSSWRYWFWGSLPQVVLVIVMLWLIR